MQCLFSFIRPSNEKMKTEKIKRIRPTITMCDVRRLFSMNVQWVLVGDIPEKDGWVTEDLAEKCLSDDVIPRESVSGIMNAHGDIRLCHAVNTWCDQSMNAVRIRNWISRWCSATIAGSTSNQLCVFFRRQCPPIAKNETNDSESLVEK